MFTSLNTGALGVSAPLDEALSLARANGFEGLDLPLGELLQLAERTSLRDVRERFHAAGVRPGGWGRPVGFPRGGESHRSGPWAPPPASPPRPRAARRRRP